MNVLVTGGASGLGEAITRACAAIPGASVLFTYHRSQENAQRLQDELANTRGANCDFGDAAGVDALAKRIEGMELNVLVNNAWSGEWRQGHFHATHPDDFSQNFKANVVPTVAITQAAIRTFRKRKSGRIVTILTSALVGAPPVGSAVYVASKACLAQLSRVWAAENAKFNIAANTVSPSFMRTPLTESTDERVIEQMEANHPLRRLLTPAEVADTVAYLCRAPAHINGVDIPINSGTVLR